MDKSFRKKSAKQLYYKLFYRYTLIIVLIVCALLSYFIASTRTRIITTNKDYTKMLEDMAVDYLKQCEDTVGYIHSDLYQSQQVLEDMIIYFTLDEEAYQEFRLDTYMATSSLAYEGFDKFLIRMFQSYPQVTNIELFSYEKHEALDCRAGGKKYAISGIEDRWKEIDAGKPAHNGGLSFLKEIRDPDSMRNIGCMVVNFSNTEFDKIQTYYANADMAVVDSSGGLVYSSSKELDAVHIQQLNQKESTDYLPVWFTGQTFGNYSVYAILDKSTAGHIPLSVFLTIFSIGAVLIAIGELLIHAHLGKLSARLSYIIDGMGSVMEGDLKVRLGMDENGDELDVISFHFNEMCEQLDRYIKKSFLAEIEQKNAEIEVLQNQINPHFLYNTLETIRMKAICNGDREVGKMLYSMAVIFRSQLKEADVITIVQELHYCKKYLELFEFRYPNKFISQVECPEEAMNYHVIKFILQPVLENYFIHGIRAEAEGNILTVNVRQCGSILCIHVIDNGRGMEDDRMAEKNRELKENSDHTRKSIGLVNVNRRLKAVYGEEYGLELAHSESGGLHITLRLPCES